jgi:hypothetical protein
MPPVYKKVCLERMESVKRGGNKKGNVFPKNSILGHKGSGCGSRTVGSCREYGVWNNDHRGFRPYEPCYRSKNCEMVRFRIL